MRTHATTALAVIAAVTVLAGGSATANIGFRTVPTRTTITAVSPAITFRALGFLTVTCRAILGGGFMDSFAKQIGRDIGGFGVAQNFRDCTNGTTVSTGLVADWNWAYTSFTGQLPTLISGIQFRLEDVAVLLDIPLLGRCLYRGSGPMHVSQAGYPGGPPAVVALTWSVVLAGACPPNITMTMSLSYGPVHTFVLF